jgi:nucleotide-binding universal stress UspA family protein
MTNVLLAIDGPLYGKAVEDFVANHRWAPETNFKLLHTIEPLRGSEAWPEARIDSKQFDSETQHLAEMASRLEKALPDAHISYEVRYGFPKEEILTEATEWPAQMIVVGSHGRHGLECFLLGSVSLAIVTHAPCSVVLIRLAQKKDTNTKSAVVNEHEIAEVHEIETLSCT